MLGGKSEMRAVSSESTTAVSSVGKRFVKGRGFLVFSVVLISLVIVLVTFGNTTLLFASGNRTNTPDTSLMNMTPLNLPVGSEVSCDRGGCYEFVYYAPHVFTMSLDSYHKATVDPYSRIIGKVSIRGDTVYITVPDSNLSRLIPAFRALRP